MLKKISLLVVVSMFVLLPLSEARFGGGSSFGSRGSRGFSTRSSGGFGSGYSSSGSRFNNNVAPSRPMTAPLAAPAPAYGGGGFLRGMAGGLAGGFLGSMLFRSMGYAGGMGGMGGGGGFGLLEMLLIGGLLFFGIRWMMGRAATAGGPGAQSSMFQGMASQQPQQRADLHVVSAPNDGPADEDSVVEAIRQYDGAFDLARFKDSRVDDFFRIQAAWGNRDLGPIRPLVANEIATSLEGEVSNLKANGRINRIENVAVRETQLVEAWQEFGKEFVTMRFYANLLDYTVDEKTGSVVDGNKNQPVKFEEYWTYTREVARPNSPWLLTAIEQQS